MCVCASEILPGWSNLRGVWDCTHDLRMKKNLANPFNLTPGPSVQGPRDRGNEEARGVGRKEYTLLPESGLQCRLNADIHTGGGGGWQVSV